MPLNVEIELKFQVPARARGALLDELSRGHLPAQRTTLQAHYLDTPDRRLARAGLAWRLRREGRQWVQTLKAAGDGPLERFEHEVVVAEPDHDALRHAGTPAGHKLQDALKQAQSDGCDVAVRFQASVRRTSRKLRTRGAVVEVSFDEGRLVAGERSHRIREVEFELVSGTPAAMLALAERWRRKFGLLYDARSKAERGDRLAEGSQYPPVRKAMPPAYDRRAGSLEAFNAVLDECLMQVCRNAGGLTDGDPNRRVDHVHQMRVGIRRLRSALRCFEGWVSPPPPELEERLRGVFVMLGRVREADVLGSGVMADLARAGAPSLETPTPVADQDPSDIARADDTQQLLLDLIRWRTSLGAVAPPIPGPAGSDALRRPARKRLRRWHERVAQDCKHFDELDRAALHTLRKRIKRQRYAVEFFEPLLKRKQLRRYREALSAIQERMGELNDLFVARDAYQQRVSQEPGAWFALGWLAARIEQVRNLARLDLVRAVDARVPEPRK